MRELASRIVTTPSSLVSMQIYVELVNKKAKVEEQQKEISLTLSGMKEQPIKSGDTQMQESSTTEDKATRLKCGFQICKPHLFLQRPRNSHEFFSSFKFLGWDTFVKCFDGEFPTHHLNSHITEEEVF